ncbi:MAG: S8 family peptidase [Candidatus Kapabacteria bacterium]|jgi:subtilisin family serine protease|nr:S8 family peptidase [Candidatus Kapabacteria bacterium]
MKLKQTGFLIALVFGLIVSACTDDMGPLDDNGPVISESSQGAIQMTNNGAARRMIVVFKEGADLEAQGQKLRGFGVATLSKLNKIHAISAMIPEHANSVLLNDPSILRIDEDVIVSIKKKPDGVGKPPKDEPDEPDNQQTPYGITLINADGLANTGSGVNVAVFDTGIDYNHPDLAANVKGGINTINTKKSYKDDNGHGTHVSGTIAALDNSEGVVGVAPQANLYGVKVLDRSGSGYLSDIIEGLEWAEVNGIDVINMSLSTDSDIQSFEDAVDYACNSAGIVIVCAAGNDGTTVDYPAAYASTIAISAIDSTYAVPYWSNIGKPIDFAAPGVGIKSTWLKGKYNTISGTSMSSPHAAGIAALAVAANSSATPAHIMSIMVSHADYIGSLTSNQQGNGVVDASAGL